MDVGDTKPVTINVSDVKEDEGSNRGKGKRRSWRIFRFDRMKREFKEYTNDRKINNDSNVIRR